MEILSKIATNLETGEVDIVLTSVNEALEQKISAEKILNDGLIAGMNVVGEKFKTREFFLPDVLMAAKAMNAGLDKLKPILAEQQAKTVGKIVIGTVQGDLHDIGKNLVSIMLKGSGFEVIDLGRDVPCEKFVETAIKENANVIGMSALLTTTMPMMKKVIELLI